MLGIKGQSLLELTIALGATVAIVSALAIITTKGLQNSQFAQNQVTATQLAQEAIDQVRSIKATNGAICVSDVPHSWNDYIWSQTGTATYSIRTTGTCGAVIPLPYLASISTPEAVPNTIFERSIIIEDVSSSSPDPNLKKATALVTWTDAQGSHQSTLVTYLANI